jgi:hypothetical protein
MISTLYQDPVFLALVAMTIAYFGQLAQALRPYQITIVQTPGADTPRELPGFSPANVTTVSPIFSRGQQFKEFNFTKGMVAPLSQSSDELDEETRRRRQKIRESLSKSLSSPTEDRSVTEEIDAILLGTSGDNQPSSVDRPVLKSQF